MARKSNPEGIKWPTDKAKYDKNYIKIFGRKCPKCLGLGYIKCDKCNGLGRIYELQNR